MKLTPRHELIGSGMGIFFATYLFYAIDPYARTMILIEKLLKIAVYCLYLLSFNLALRFRHRYEGLDPDSDEAMKKHIKFSMFFLGMLELTDLYLFLSEI